MIAEGMKIVAAGANPVQVRGEGRAGPPVLCSAERWAWLPWHHSLAHPRRAEVSWQS